MKLYICLTYYHALVTQIKGLISKERFDVLLANDIPDYNSLKKRLEESNVFNSILEYDAKNIRNRRKGKKDLIYYLTDKKTIIKQIEKYNTTDFKKYSDIYIYHDVAEIGKYFILKGIKYHLLEDALDYFKYFDKYYNLKKGSYCKGTTRFFLKDKFGFGYKCRGASKSCIDIEVNDLDGIIIPYDKCFEVPRKALFEKLSAEDRIIVFNTFATGKRIQSTNKKTAIICTQPLYNDSFVKSQEEQLLVFDRIISDYKNQDYHIVIKPHPRDDIDYTNTIMKYDCDLIDKNMPSEILNYNPDARFDIAISITSTAINFLKYAKEKKFMGRDFILEVLGNV